MSVIYMKESSKRFLEELKSTNEKEAKDFLFQKGYSASSFEIPEYYVPSGFEDIKLKEINWSKDWPRITKSIDFLTPKGFLGWRRFSFIHPYIYIHIVNEITKPDSWERIKEILTKETSVFVYSTPTLKIDDDEYTKKQAIDRWVLMAEKDLIKDSINFSFLTVTDIKNFYPSIYTHSLCWAIEGKAVSKLQENRKNYNLLGNRIDKLFQNMSDGQTNGIPVGSVVSDIFAEIILKSVDGYLSEWLDEEDLDDVLISRYRDDYRILSKTEEEGRKVLKQLARILNQEYNLHLNEEKTFVYDDILNGAVRDWSSEINGDFLLRQVKYEKMDTNIDYSYLNDILFKIYKIQKKFPNGRPAVTLLSKLITHLENKDTIVTIDDSGIHSLIAILRKISLIREEVGAYAFMLLDVFFSKIDKKLQEILLDEILESVNNASDYDYQVVWLYRLCLAHNPEIAKKIDLQSSKLLMILDNDFLEGGHNDIEIFDEVVNLDPEDKEELNKFSLANAAIFYDSVEVRINKDFLSSMSYKR